MHGGARPVRLTTVALLGLLAACSSSGPRARPSSTSGSATAPVSLPALPKDLAAANPCAHAGSAFTAASTYLGLAQLGRADEAQRCVHGGAVPRTVTAGLTVSGSGGFYTPAGSTTGSTIRFVPATGGAAVTVLAEPAGGGYAVTSVRRG